MYRSAFLLSQAAAHPRRGTYNTRNGKPARNVRHATQQEKKKQRRKTIVIAGLYARNDASKRKDYKIHMIILLHHVNPVILSKERSL
jgi:hypothetical protein